MSRGAMDGEIIGGLINSISRFIHLVACQTIKSAAIKDFRKIVGILKLLKPVLDEALDSELPLDGHLVKESEELDAAVNDARELTEKAPHRMSKIYTVLQSEPMLLRVQKSASEICHFLSALQSSPFSTSIQHCMQEVQYMEQDPISELIDHALKDLKENTIPSLDDVIKIMDTLSLASNQELLMESIALEKEKAKAELKSKTEIIDHINWITVLVSHICYCMEKLEQFGFVNGVPVPLHFRCPLSLQLMLDPVILASGQTYERSFIQKWLDNGLRFCPKTRQTLIHTNLIPNYTVKALIANWCEKNSIKLGSSAQPENISYPYSSTAAFEDIQHEDDHRHSTSRSSLESYDKTELHKVKISSGCGQQDCSYYSHHQTMADKVNLQGDALVEKNSCHSHSESISSVISSIEVMSKFDEKVSLPGDITYPSCLALNKELSSSSWLCSNQHFGSKNRHGIDDKCQPLLQSSGLDDLTTAPHVQNLIDDLKSEAPALQTAAASKLRLLAKNNMENRVLIGKCGAIPSLVSLLYSNVKKVQENAVTALLNLSINDDNKVLIAEAGAVEPLIHVLECGTTEAKENSAAAFFSLSAMDEYKAKIGRSGAVKALVYLLETGSPRGKKDAATALFNLSIFHENKARIVQAGAVKYLFKLMELSTGMVDKSVALLANLSTIPEGRIAIAQEGGIPLLVEVVETGSQRGKENAASTLFQLCLSSQKFCSLVLQEGAVPPLIALSQFGTPRGKEKAQQILSHFRSQREGAARKKKS
ncbi:Kinesin-associated protein (KAP) [Musa troglodytarum]|uniref:RING-type E3 ubiquitin transferase n=1 Tax=Musa troglodytarum TaxID=320322 RepID=A0A9E7FWF6_9LILI|nr:Kinesin-associated protein (KAP) [Musa troglodytarum]